MLKKLMLATIASLVLVGGMAEAAPPAPQEFHLSVTGEMEVGEYGFLGINDIGGWPGLNSGFQKINKNTKRIVFQTCTPNCVPFSLGVEGFWWSLFYPIVELSGSDCFPSDGMVEGAILISKTKNGDAKAVFWFRADNFNGDTVKYVLTLTGGGWSGSDDFPPPIFNDIAEMDATAWKMETEGKGQHRHTSCKDTGNFGGPAGVMFTVKNITP